MSDHSSPSAAVWVRRLSRRDFVVELGLLAAAATTVLGATELLRSRGWVETAQAADIDLVHDTLNGLVAFVVPGPDAYSVHQGESTPEPGGIAADITDPLIATLDAATPFVPSFSAVVASILNDVAQQVKPDATGPFPSHFARLSFVEKVQVLASMEGNAPLAPLGGLLPAVAAFLSYSEAGVVDPGTRVLSAPPVGWALTGYEGVAEGRDELLGYFQNRRRVTG